MSDKIINESMRIAGKKIDFDKKIDVEYPFTGEVIGTVPAGNAEHAKNALEIAANYTPKLTRYERQKILQNAAEELIKRKVTSGCWCRCTVVKNKKRPPLSSWWELT